MQRRIDEIYEAIRAMLDAEYASSTGVLTPMLPGYLVAAVLKNNVLAGSLGFTFNTSVEQYFKNLRDNVGGFIFAEEMSKQHTLVGYPYRATNLLETAGGKTKMIFGDWNDLVIGEQGALEIETSREGSWTDEAGNLVSAFENDQTLVRAINKALTNQGKTTLADTLISKFKIVGFEPPSKSPALPAKFTIDFTSVVFGEAIPAGKNLWVKIGGDDDAVIELTTAEEIITAAQLTALFSDTSFTKGGKTYTAAVAEGVVTYTATVPGSADSIPERINVYADEIMTEELMFKPDDTVSVKFINGEDEVSAADSLIKTIQRFQADEDNDWYYLLTDRIEDEYVMALSKFAEASEPTEAELSAGVEDHRKFYMGQTTNKKFACNTARAAVIYTDPEFIDEEPDASYTGNVAPFYPKNVTWKFKRPQDGNAPASAGTKLISLPKLKERERDELSENHVNYLTEEYKRQYVKEGVCLNGEFIDVVIGGDWIAKRMRDLLYDILLANANINYGDDGFGLVATAVLQALAEAADESHNIVARDQKSKSGIFTVNIPKYAESTEEQRRNRIMPDITWEALLAGAVHQVKTKGALRASL